MFGNNASAAVENRYPTSGLTTTSDYSHRAGISYGTTEAGFVRFGHDPNGQAWLVVDMPRRGSRSGRSIHLTMEVAREMRDTLDALLESSYTGPER